MSIFTSELDFVHLSQLESQLIGHAPPVLLNRKEGHALLADRIPQGQWGLCPGLYSTCLAACARPHDRRHPCSGSADGASDSPDDGTPCRARLSDVSSC